MRTNAVELLISHGIKPSPQRLAVYAALVGRRDHPSAEMIFEELKPKMPTMSKTTVLTAMRLFQSVGLARDVRCEEGELRFDGYVDFHAHFKCRKCGGLFDVAVEGEHKETFVAIPKGFEVDDEQLIYYGFCSRCKTKKGAKK